MMFQWGFDPGGAVSIFWYDHPACGGHGYEVLDIHPGKRLGAHNRCVLKSGDGCVPSPLSLPNATRIILDNNTHGPANASRDVSMHM